MGNNVWGMFWFLLALANITVGGINWEGENYWYVLFNGLVALCCIFAGVRIINR